MDASPILVSSKRSKETTFFGQTHLSSMHLHCPSCWLLATDDVEAPLVSIWWCPAAVGSPVCPQHWPACSCSIPEDVLGTG